MSNFEKFNFKEYINKTLSDLHFESPTAIQEKVLPLALNGKDIIGKSPTGSGKTHAYLLPILQNIDVTVNEVQAVIMTPTRELATQIYNNLVEFTKNEERLRLRLITGGLDRSRMIQKVSKVPHIVIGTPGRIKDIGLDNAEFNMMSAKMLVLDEADMIMETGFLDDVSLIAAKMPDKLQMLVFSATVPQTLKVFLQKYMHAPLLLEITKKEVTPETIDYYLVPARHRDKKEVLLNVLSGIQPYLCLIFCSKKETVTEIYSFLKKNKYNVGVIHGDLEPNIRRNMMKKIYNNEFAYIVASDIAARGIDIEGVSHVINIDLPRELEFFFHRAGRSDRNGAHGICYTIYNKDDVQTLYKIMDSKVSFKSVEYKNDEWKELQPLVRPRKKKEYSDDLNNQIRSIVVKNKAKKVKPGYKKKVKEEIEKTKKKHRREMIKKNIKDQIKKRAIEKTKREKYGDEYV